MNDTVHRCQTYHGSAALAPVLSIFAFCQPSDILELKTALGMQPRKVVTLTGPLLTMCKLTKGGRGTRTCKVSALRQSVVHVISSRRYTPPALLASLKYAYPPCALSSFLRS